MIVIIITVNNNNNNNNNSNFKSRKLCTQFTEILKSKNWKHYTTLIFLKL